MDPQGGLETGPSLVEIARIIGQQSQLFPGLGLAGAITVGLGQLSHLLQGAAGLRTATHHPQGLAQHQLSLGHPHCLAGIILRQQVIELHPLLGADHRLGRLALAQLHLG